MTVSHREIFAHKLTNSLMMIALHSAFQCGSLLKKPSARLSSCSTRVRMALGITLPSSLNCFCTADRRAAVICSELALGAAPSAVLLLLSSPSLDMVVLVWEVLGGGEGGFRGSGVGCCGGLLAWRVGCLERPRRDMWGSHSATRRVNDSAMSNMDHHDQTTTTTMTTVCSTVYCPRSHCGPLSCSFGAAFRAWELLACLLSHWPRWVPVITAHSLTRLLPRDNRVSSAKALVITRTRRFPSWTRKSFEPLFLQQQPLNLPPKHPPTTPHTAAHKP